MIINDSSENGEIIDSIYKVYKVNNVKECHCDFDCWKIEINENNDTTNQNIFFICEINPTAIGHWVYESAVYLQLFKLLKEKYHTIKLIIIGKRMFKNLFFNLFGISDSDIIYQDIYSTENMYVIPNDSASNICIFPSPISSLHCKSINPAYTEHLIRFCNYFKKINIENSDTIETLIMPRQKKENFVHNNRNIDFSHILDFYQINNLNHTLLHTDDVTDINYQITQLRSARHIIVCDGAAFSLNLLLCSNKNFYVINRFSELQQQYYPMAKHLIEILCTFNNNKYFYFNDQDDFLRCFNLIT